jgi:tRNA(Ile)-lysidine synthase TilS/MesJ
MHTHDFDWREDASNAQKKYKRNAVRLDLIPAMEHLAGGAGALRK